MDVVATYASSVTASGASAGAMHDNATVVIDVGRRHNVPDPSFLVGGLGARLGFRHV